VLAALPPRLSRIPAQPMWAAIGVGGSPAPCSRPVVAYTGSADAGRPEVAMGVPICRAWGPGGWSSTIGSADVGRP